MPGNTGHASPQPIVITMSAASACPAPSGLGTSSEMSTPTSAIAAATAGFTRSAGSDPADVTRTAPPASLASSAAAICDRPALWVHMNSTSGTSATATASRQLPAAGTAPAAAFSRPAGSWPPPAAGPAAG